MPTVLVAGSLKSESNAQKVKQFQATCRSIGKLLANRNITIALGSEDRECADLYVAEGADLEVQSSRWNAILIQPTNTDQNDVCAYSEFSRMSTVDHIVLSGDWLNPEIRKRQLEAVDLAILIGGGVGTECLAKAAHSNDVATIALGAFGGSTFDQFELSMKTLQSRGINLANYTFLKHEFSFASVGVLLSSLLPLASDVAPVESGPLDTWKEKLEHLQKQEAITSDAAQMFTIRKQIDEAKQKIRELSG